MPVHLLPCKTAYHVFKELANDGTWTSINNLFGALVREKAGKGFRLTTVIMGSQSVKSDPHCGNVGYDGTKQIKGPKCHLLVDRLGLKVHVKPSSTAERQGAKHLLAPILCCLSWLRILWGDGGYIDNALASWVHSLRSNVKVEVMKRSDKVCEFRIRPRHRVVERTFGWPMRYCRQVRDSETKESHAEAFVCFAMILLQLRRLA